jgi:hypothetical protein
MKKGIFLVIILACLFSQASRAQQKPFVFGFKVAPNTGWFKTDTEGYENVGTQPGFSWGFIALFNLMEHYSLGTGFNVVYLNATLQYPHLEISDGDTLSGMIESKYRTKYIQIPLVFNMETKDFGRFRFYGQIGLGTSFLIGANADNAFTYEGGSDKEDKVDVYDDLRFIRESLIVGAGAKFIIEGSTLIFANITFDNGFTNVLKGDNTLDPSLSQRANTNFIEFQIGMLF